MLTIGIHRQLARIQTYAPVSRASTKRRARHYHANRHNHLDSMITTRSGPQLTHPILRIDHTPSRFRSIHHTHRHMRPSISGSHAPSLIDHNLLNAVRINSLPNNLIASRAPTMLTTRHHHNNLPIRLTRNGINNRQFVSRTRPLIMIQESRRTNRRVKKRALTQYLVPSMDHQSNPIILMIPPNLLDKYQPTIDPIHANNNANVLQFMRTTCPLRSIL